MKKVGILGGMGPEATILLMQKLIEGVSASDDSEHIPLIVHQNTQVPSRIKALLDGCGPDPASVLEHMAIELENMGCDILAMPCNTAHHYHSQLSESVKIPVINMISLSCKALIKKKKTKVGILASPVIKKVGIFDQYLVEYGLQAMFSENDNCMLEIITKIKEGTIDNPLIETFTAEVEKIVERGCDSLLIACTELSLLSHEMHNIDFVDSIDCLSDEIIRLAS